jgi:hypothetical protein
MALPCLGGLQTRPYGFILFLSVSSVVAFFLSLSVAFIQIVFTRKMMYTYHVSS